jgi:hypothetical protein
VQCKVSASSSVARCSLYLAPSKIPNAGRGVFAGKYFDINDLVDIGPTLLIRSNDCTDTQLEDYVFGSDHEDYSMVAFGPPSLFNSHPNKSLYYNWQPQKIRSDGQFEEFTIAPQSVMNHNMPYTTYTRTIFYALRVIEDGEELLSHYGDGWFEARDMSDSADSSAADCSETETCPYNEDISQPKEQAAPIQDPHVASSDSEEQAMMEDKVCLSDIDVRTSSIPDAGLGVFATRDFKQGELITVSPILTLPRGMVDSTIMTSLLMNYCIADPNGDSAIVLFPIAKAALFNHRLAPHDNVEMKWFFWGQRHHPASSSNNIPLQEVVDVDPDTLVASPVAPLDMGFYAKRDICEGEELFLNYGDDWDSAWKRWMEYSCSGEKSCMTKDEHLLPFRHYIIGADDLFPEAWKNLTPPQQ